MRDPLAPQLGRPHASDAIAGTEYVASLAWFAESASVRLVSHHRRSPTMISLEYSCRTLHRARRADTSGQIQPRGSSSRDMRYVTVTLLTAFAIGCSQRTDSSLDGILAQYASQGRFMGTVLVARGDEVLLRKGYGSADLEKNIPNAPATKFRLGSVTKQFTAASILLLHEQGRLNIDDSVGKYVPEAPQSWENSSLVHLLTHTSGIPDFTGLAEYPTLKVHPSTAGNTMSWFRDKPLDFSPGERWRYSNSAYVVLGIVIENISGLSYEQFVRDSIFRPLGMSHSGYTPTTAIAPHHASGTHQARQDQSPPVSST